MKVIALTLTTLCLAVAAYTNKDYELRCTREEVAINWPSYHSSSEYLVCQGVGGRVLIRTCPSGELFTFVLQGCTSPAKYIPPPPMEILPTSSPMSPQPIPQETKPLFPRPIHPMDPDFMRPPVIISEHPPLVQQPIITPPVFQQPIDHPPVITDNELPQIMPEEEISGPPSKPIMPHLPGKPKPQLPHKKPAAPMPPTPAPTPPMVKVTQAPKKQTGKKQPPALPGASKKQPPALPGAAKKQPPKPAGKKTGPTPPKKV